MTQHAFCRSSSRSNAAQEFGRGGTVVPVDLMNLHPKARHLSASGSYSSHRRLAVELIAVSIDDRIRLRACAGAEIRTPTLSFLISPSPIMQKTILRGPAPR